MQGLGSSKSSGCFGRYMGKYKDVQGLGFEASRGPTLDLNFWAVGG